jgi:hypothetical protein
MKYAKTTPFFFKFKLTRIQISASADGGHRSWFCAR